MKFKPVPKHRALLLSSGVLFLAVVLIYLSGASRLFGQQQQQQPPTDRGQQAVALYVRDRVLGGNFGDKTIWMTPAPIDPTFVVKDLIADRKFELRSPYPKAWLVMIDDQPKANFAHEVRWLFVDDQLTKHSEPIKKDFPPSVVSPDGQLVAFRCVPGVTATACEELVLVPSVTLRPPKVSTDSCLYAVLVSGGISPAANYSRYPQNLRSMYSMLRNCGYPAANISVYYADGRVLDLDNADGDNNDNTGSDVTGAANEGAIRARIQNLCQTLDRNRDVLFTYFTNHGADNTGVCLWDNNNNGSLESGELLAPAELSADTANCSVCRHFMIHDQCYAGDFLPMATDGSHANLAVYSAATATEVSWGREYLAEWETNNPGTTTMNAMHQDVVANGNLTSTPGMAEGTAGLGNVSPCTCCGLVRWPWWYWVVLILILIFLTVIIIRLMKRPRPGPVAG
ncbi:MAG TPA: hypothetical protein VGW36_01335 [Pyrinomonadaceae bacterium]|nr:hypothetical protein [Pyrinomonadaceae bacterium]